MKFNITQSHAGLLKGVEGWLKWCFCLFCTCLGWRGVARVVRGSEECSGDGWQGVARGGEEW